uniref:protein-tyrosine-phosphatase n=3 Tax=Magallana gigas TaxID=29159 RepID=A0A8W8MZN3_MAGGI|nr:uncharacterized protein LOC105330922 isoform X1 [Crassostrea gigas]
MDFQWVIFEVFVILLTHISKEVLSFVGNNVSQSSGSSIQNGPESAFDNSDDTCAVTNYGAGNYWRIQFNQTLTVKSVELRLKGGNYTIEVGNSLKKVSDRHVCASEHLPFPSSKYTVNVRCKPAVRGDIINIKRVDTGTLILCDFKLRVCELGSQGKPCPMCTSDSTCRHCDQSHYGDSCEHNCFPGCVPGSCDELTGECNCTTGFTGTHCQFLGDVCANCFSSCLEYEALLGNCTPCQNSIYGNRCDKECSHNCESCDIRNGTCYKCQQNFKGKNCKDHVGSNKDPTFWVLFTFGFLLLITTPILVNRFYKRFQCCKTIQAYFEPPTNLSEHDGERTRFSLSSSRVILEPEGDRRNSNDPYNQAIQVVVTFNSLNAKPQPIEQFVKETHQKMMTNEFRSEFKVLPNGLMNLHTEALKRENITKNRFKKIYPYDANRVILMSSGGSYSGDYINASYIQGVYKEDAYIAAQGPFTEQTIVDFWRMVWQVKSRRIVMLTCLTEDSKEKCMQYWPDDVGEYGPFHVIIQKREVFDKFTIRKFIVRKGEETKRVNHYQFTVWPDTKVPESLEGLLCFRNLTKNSLRSDEGPMIVHGSAGIGRTGTFIALDYLLEKGFKEGSVDVKTCVISLRQQRPFAIQSVDQYAFLHDALVEGFTNISWNCALHVLDEM